MALGTGVMNIKEKILLIKKLDVYAVIEVKQEMELVESVNYLKNNKIAMK